MLGVFDVMEHDFIFVSNKGELIIHVSCEDISEISLFEEPFHEKAEDFLVCRK